MKLENQVSHSDANSQELQQAKQQSFEAQLAMKKLAFELQSLRDQLEQAEREKTAVVDKFQEYGQEMQK